MYHVPLALQCIYERSDEGGANGDGEEGSDISGDCLASCIQMTCFLWGVAGRPEGDGGTFC